MGRMLAGGLAIAMAVMLGGCTTLGLRDPVQVTVADIESIPGEDLEVRMLVKLRVQNPNDEPVQYDGIYLKLEVLGSTFATGVSDERGTIPRFGESVISVPMTMSTLRVASRALSMFSTGRSVDKLNYKLDGKLDGPMLGSTRFQLTGEFNLPAPSAARAKPRAVSPY